MEGHSNVFCTLFAVMGASMVDFYAHLEWWLYLAVAMLLLDLRFGIKAAQVRGEVIRFSRAWRRTLNKSIDYLGWVTVAEILSRTFGVTIGEPVVSKGVLLFVYTIELSSCINNYLEYKGLPWRFDPFKWIKEKVLFGEMFRKKRHSPEEEVQSE